MTNLKQHLTRENLLKLTATIGTLAVYRVRTVGGLPKLKALKRYPAALEN